MRPAVGYLRSNSNTNKVMGNINNASYGLTHSSTGMLQFNGTSYVFDGDINVLKGTVYFDGIAKTINGGNSANNINVSAGAIFQSQSGSTTAQNFTGTVTGAGTMYRTGTQQWNVTGNWAGFTGTLNVGGSTNRHNRYECKYDGYRSC